MHFYFNKKQEFEERKDKEETASRCWKELQRDNESENSSEKLPTISVEARPTENGVDFIKHFPHSVIFFLQTMASFYLLDQSPFCYCN